jgi:hypothetical protein
MKRFFFFLLRSLADKKDLMGVYDHFDNLVLDSKLEDAWLLTCPICMGALFTERLQTSVKAENRHSVVGLALLLSAAPPVIGSGLC